MTDMKHKQAFEDRIRAQLDARSEALDTTTRQRLDRARHQALAGKTRRILPRWTWPAMAGVGAAAAIVVTVVVTITALQSPQPGASSAPQTADLDVLTRDDFELLTEDPEFYAWIAAQSESAEDEPAGEGRSG